MLAIEQQNRPCQHCQRLTIHSRNVKRMNWLLHIVLAVVTFGGWLVFALILALGCGPTSGWVCGQCGSEQRHSAIPLRDQVSGTSRTTWAVAIVFVVGSIWWAFTRN
jgi:hypothetical protein